MNIAVREKCLLLYFDWCVQESRTELLRGLSTIRKVASSSAMKYVSFIDSLTPHQQAPASLALVKRYHLEALKIGGDGLSDEDQSWIRAFCDHGKTWQVPGVRSRVVVGEKMESIARRKLLDKSKLTTEVLSRVQAMLGAHATPFGSSSEWLISQTEAEFRLDTYIKLGARRPLTYSQVARNLGGASVIGNSSFMQWYGITADTSWDLLTNKDISNAADLLASFCQRFSTAFGGIAAECIRSA